MQQLSVSLQRENSALLAARCPSAEEHWAIFYVCTFAIIGFSLISLCSYCFWNTNFYVFPYCTYFGHIWCESGEKVEIIRLASWQGGRRPTLKPTASTTEPQSELGRRRQEYYYWLCMWWRPPPPPDHHIYNCLNFFVSQPIFFKLGHIIDMTWAGVIGWLLVIEASYNVKIFTWQYT